jgi:hypothetical protein
MKAAGIKLNVGIQEVDDYREFLTQVSCNISGLTIGEQHLECKYYDEDTGEMYLHFIEGPIDRGELEGFFEEDCIINEL